METKIKEKKESKTEKSVSLKTIKTKKTETKSKELDKKKSKKHTKEHLEKEESKKNKKNCNIIKKTKKIDKKSMFYIAILVIDIIITIYFARRNIANFIKLNGEKTKYIGATKNLIFGRNYIVILTSFLFASYNCLTQKKLFNQKNTKKSIIMTFIGYLVLNMILFFIFTKRVY